MIRLAGVLAFALAALAPAPVSALTVTDQTGRTVTLAAPPRRIVSLVPGVTEMLCQRGRVLALVSSDMGGIDPPPFGPSSSRLYRRNRAAETLATRLAALTRFEGLCGFDWLQRDGPDGPVAVARAAPCAWSSVSSVVLLAAPGRRARAL